MRVILAEKPSVGREIAKALGGFSKSPTNRFLTNSKDCIITWAIGHLVELYHPSTQDINKLPILPTEDEWQLRIIGNDGYQEQFDAIKDLFDRNDVTEIVNACDAGREGELIGRLIYQKSGSTKPLKRMWINSMTKDGLTKAYKQIGSSDKYEGLNQAARCRSKSDWVVGINGSIAATAVMSRKQSLSQITAVGRVKTPVLTMVVHRQREIDNFISEKSYGITGSFAVGASKYQGKWINYEAMLKKRNAGNNAEAETDTDDDENGEKQDSLSMFSNKEDANAVYNACMNGSNPKPVSKIIENKALRKNNAPHLFDLTTLQYEANKRFKISSKETLELTQELYEKHKAVTYPRTDSTHLPEDYPNEVNEIFDKLISENEHNSPIVFMAKEAKNRVGEVGKHIFDNKKISDHFAIIPTGKGLEKGSGSKVEKIYLLIVERFKAAFLPPMEYNETERFTFIGDHAFRSVGNEIISDGWTALFKNNEKGESKKGKKEVVLPSFENESDVVVESVKVIESKSTPPKPFTNGTLIRAMQNISRYLTDGEEKKALKDCGIGTPATRANIIDDLLSTESANGRKKQAMLEEVGSSKYIVPTEYGKEVVAFLEEMEINSLTQASFTAKWEMKLEDVNKEADKSDVFMDETYSIVDDFIGKLKEVHRSIPMIKLSGCKCPECDSELNVEPKTVICSNGSCNFKIMRVVASRTLVESELDVLIQHKETGVLGGFVKRGDGKNPDKPFNAALKLGKNAEGVYEITFHFPVDKYSLPCPICSGEMESNSSMVKCKARGCGFTVWRSVNKKAITEQEIKQLISEGKTDVIQDFISSKGSKFPAKLMVNKDEKRVCFNFVEVSEKDIKGEPTGDKCAVDGCDGKYELKGHKYICTSCDHWLIIKLKKMVKPFTKAQMSSLIKGKSVVHSVYLDPDFDSAEKGKDGKDMATEKVEFYLSKEKRLYSKAVEKV